MAPRRMTRRTRKAVTFAVAAGAVLGAAFGITPLSHAYHDAILRRDLSRLVVAATAQSSPRSRLSVATAPRRVEMRSAIETSRPIGLYAAADSVLQSAKQVSGAASNRAAGVAHYYIGDYAHAVRELKQVVLTSPSAAAWNDLAAAQLETSRNQVLEAVPALVSVENALAADPTFSAALYNRAAILEQMELWQHARDAWRLALIAENDPRWRNDIGKHVDAIPPEGDERIALKTIDGLDPSDAAGVVEGVDRFPQEARRLAEGALPAQWAAAVVKGDPATAEKNLNLARAIAAALRDRSGETLAAEAVAAIDAAVKSGSEARMSEIVAAYSVYGKGRGLLNARDFAAAETQFAEAVRLFARANSSMASVARYYAASAILEQYRLDDAAAENAAITRAERAMRGHRGLAAHLAWQMARTEGGRGHWDAALAAAQTAVDSFRALGEKQSAGFMENMLAEIHDYLGQPERAWTHRLAAFDLLSRAGNARQLQVSLGGAARERIRRKDWSAALALLDLEIAESRHAGQPSLLGDALSRRSRARAASGDVTGARQDVASARAAAPRVKDPREHEQIIAAIDTAEGIVDRERDPANSVQLFTNAIACYERASRIRLPDLYLERGRAQLARGSEIEALADFSTGIDRLEEQRATLSDLEFNSTAADVAEDLFIEAVRAAVRRGDAERAYGFSERSRGRALLSRLAPGDAPAPTRVQDGTRVVELMVLPEKVIVFTIDRELRMKELAVARADLERMVDAFTAGIVNDSGANEVRAAAAELYDVLLRPLGAVTSGVSTLVFVPNGILERVPWAALYDREQMRYVVENVTVTSAPSVTLFARMPAAGATPVRRALIVGNPKLGPAFVDLPALRGAEEEARTIAGHYPAHALLLGADATTGRVRREAESCDVLHFAAHAISSESADNRSFLVLASDETTGDSGVLYSRDIARLKLKGVSLVVLAACGSIRGSAVHIDGMPSIGRSFIAAGAKAVVGTLWNVDDERSAALFARIHRDVAAGMPVAQAVRDAQIHALRSRAPLNVWGGLVLIGGATR